MKSDAGNGSPPEKSRGPYFLLIVASLALAWLLLPFYGTIMWGAIIALYFSPLYRALLARLGRQRQTTAAFLTLLVVLVAVVLPFGFLAASLVGEMESIYERMQSGELNPVLYFRGVFGALPGWMRALLDRLGMGDFDALQRRLGATLLQASQLLATQALSLGQNTFEFAARLAITLYLTFFLIRDGDVIVLAIRHAIPLSQTDKDALLEKFTAVIRATIKGNMLVAAIQGALGGLAFWMLGMTGILIWSLLMAFLSLVPAVGAALIWFPVAIYLFVTGAIWKSVALVAYGVLVIGLVDNLLRPLLVGKDTRLPDCVVMISTLGGLAVMGINGFVLGPAIAAMFFAAWHIFMKMPAAPDVVV